MVAEIAALDLWTFFVEYVFGNFFVAIIALAIIMFIIMGFIGKISIYTCAWYIVLFAIAMAIGYFQTAFVIVTQLVILFLFYLSMKGLFDRAGQ